MSLVFMNRGRLKRTHARDARQRRPSVTTWSCISDRRGDTTITTGLLDVDIPVTRPVSQSAQNGSTWYTSDLPNPVGTLTKVSLPLKIASMAESCSGFRLM